MKRFRWMRNAAVGAAFGTALALCLHLWQEYASTSGMAPEGVSFITYFIALLLGFPTSVLLSAVLDVPGWSEYLVLLFGIVVNWCSVFLLAGRIRKRR